MKLTPIAILIAGAAIVAAILYVNGAFETIIAAHPYEKAVREKFVDPDSVQFRAVVEDKSKFAICGEVNAKNRMGGYTGWQRFFAMDRSLINEPWLVTTASELNNNFPFWCSFNSPPLR